MSVSRLRLALLLVLVIGGCAAAGGLWYLYRGPWLLAARFPHEAEPTVDRFVALDAPSRADYESLAAYHPQLWSAAVRSIVRQRRPHVLIVPATANGRDLAPRVAGELHLGMTGDCVGLGIDRAGRLIQTKPAYGGNIVSIIMGATTPQLATVRPRMFEPLEPRQDLEPEQHRMPLETVQPARLLHGRRTAAEKGPDDAGRGRHGLLIVIVWEKGAASAASFSFCEHAGRTRV